VFVLCVYPVAKKLGFSCAQFVKGLFIRFPKGLGLFVNTICAFLIKVFFAVIHRINKDQ
jgi:hypothetical protein